MVDFGQQIIVKIKATGIVIVDYLLKLCDQFVFPFIKKIFMPIWHKAFEPLWSKKIIPYWKVQMQPSWDKQVLPQVKLIQRTADKKLEEFHIKIGRASCRERV